MHECPLTDFTVFADMTIVTVTIPGATAISCNHTLPSVHAVYSVTYVYTRHTRVTCVAYKQQEVNY